MIFQSRKWAHIFFRHCHKCGQTNSLLLYATRATWSFKPENPLVLKATHYSSANALLRPKYLIYSAAKLRPLTSRLWAVKPNQCCITHTHSNGSSIDLMSDFIPFIIYDGSCTWFESSNRPWFHKQVTHVRHCKIPKFDDMLPKKSQLRSCDRQDFRMTWRSPIRGRSREISHELTQAFNCIL